jgi:hypothetical protein
VSRAAAQMAVGRGGGDTGRAGDVAGRGPATLQSPSQAGRLSDDGRTGGG